MLESIKKSIEFMKKVGWDYFCSQAIIDSFQKKLLADEYPLVETAFLDERNRLICYLENANSDEERVNFLINEGYEVPRHRYEEIIERNKFIKEELDFVIGNREYHLEKKMSRDYEELDFLFYEKFNRVPKIMDTIKLAGALSNAFAEEIVNNFDMKLINYLRKRNIPDVNVFMFMFKNPWMKKTDCMKMTKKEILSLSRKLSYEEDRELLNFCYKKYGREGLNKAQNALEEEDDIGYRWSCFKNDLKKFDVSISDLLDALSIETWRIARFFEEANDKIILLVKEGIITLSQAIEVAGNLKVFDLMKQHDLKDAPVSLGKETASIMAWNDLRQVFLGDYTHCCQRIDEAGESSMMFGLVSKHSGFFTIQRDNKVLAQAWVWEAKADTLVLDNIELADCREVDQFIDILYKWVKKSPYENIQLGLGYSDMKVGVPMTHSEIRYYSLFRSRAFTKHTKSFFRGKEIYTDAQERRSWLKKDGEMQFSKTSFEKQKELEEQEEREAMLANLAEYAIDAIF